jgi:hypothetical protein
MPTDSNFSNSLKIANITVTSLSLSSLLLLIFKIFDLMLSDWVSFLAYPNLFGIKGFVVVVVQLLH